MKLNQIPNKAEVVLTVKDAATTLDFKTKVRDALGDNGIWVDIIKDSSGRTVNFSGISVMLSYAGINGSNHPFVWSKVTVKLLKVEGKVRQAIISSVEGEQINRRRVYRHLINIMGVARFVKHEINAKIYDVSSTGFSFICDKEDATHGTSALVTCVYKDLDSDITLDGKVVRIQKLNDDKVLYGCRYTGRTDIIVNYVRRKKAADMENK